MGIVTKVDARGFRASQKIFGPQGYVAKYDRSTTAAEDAQKVIDEAAAEDRKRADAEQEKRAAIRERILDELVDAELAKGKVR